MRNMRQPRVTWRWSTVEIILSVITFASFLASVKLQICPANGILAGVDFDVNNTNDSATSAFHYLLTGKGAVNCKGVVQEWIFHTLTPCSAGLSNIDFEVWRPTTGTNYQLVGRNSYTPDCSQITNTTSVTFGIGPVDQIPVEPGYVIGWWYQSTNTLEISYIPVSDVNSVFAEISITAVALGDDLIAVQSSNLLDYSLQVNIKQGNYPTLDNLPAQINIAENIPVPPPTFTNFTVIASDISNIDYDSAVYFDFSWSPAQPFYLSNASNTNNGETSVFSIASLDYETQSVYQLSITVTALGLSTTQILTINVIDLNEPQTIANLPATIAVPAPSTAAGNEVFRVLINDPDINPPTPVGFYLSSWSSPDTASDMPPFAVDPVTGSITANMDLTNWFLRNPTAAPSYPTSVTYAITILATDGQYSDSKNLTVQITQIKQPPVILNLPNSITINDNTAANSMLYQVIVSPTSDTNLSYQMTPPVANFCLDQLSGVISVCSYATLTCQPASSITVTVTNSALSSSGILTINIQWVRTAPSFSQPVYSGSVQEKCPPIGGSCSPLVPVTLAVPIVVQDSNCAQSFGCTLVPGTGSQFFSITTDCQTVNNILPIDIDANPQYDTITLPIQVQDNVLSAYATVNISVISINDSPPTFNPDVFNASVLENAPGGTSVTTVKASDLDRGRNGVFSYSILTSDPSFLYFQVDAQSGLITTKQPLDYESITAYTLIVWAIDEGTLPGPLTGSATVYITVIDVNDNRPYIVCTNRPSDEPYPAQPCFYNYDLKYDAIVGSNVSDLLMTAFDADPVQSEVDFQQLVLDSHFSLNESNGLIKVAASVTAYTKYVLYVYAEDVGTPSLRSRIVYVRIDTYRPDKHWIDLTVRPAVPSFDPDEFLAALRNVTSPWFMKIVSVTTYNPSVEKDVIVTVYALADTSTYQPENIADTKVFVPRDELLTKLRKNIYGDPRDLLLDPPFQGIFPVIKVMPSYVNWWLDTVEGIATIACLAVIPLVTAAVIVIAILKALKLLCFKPSSSGNAMKTANSDSSSTGLSQNSSRDNVRHRRSSHGRRASVLTVHSDIELS